jgi:hypothetical protein
MPPALRMNSATDADDQPIDLAIAAAVCPSP